MVGKGTFPGYAGGNRGSENMWGKDNVLKLRLNSLKRDAGAGEEPEFWVGLCYRASNCQDAKAGGAALCWDEFGVSS